MAKTKGWIVTNGEGAGADHGAVFCYSRKDAEGIADAFASEGYSGHIMRVKGVWGYTPVEREVITVEREAMLTDDYDTCEDYVK